jgi:hypothetical protein
LTSIKISDKVIKENKIMNPKNENNWLTSKWLKTALDELDAATKEQLHERTAVWQENFMELAFSHFITVSKEGKILTGLAIKSINSKEGSKKYLKELYKVLSKVDGIKFIGEE